MLGHRLRRWRNIAATLGQRLTFAGMLVYFGTSVADVDQQKTGIGSTSCIRWDRLPNPEFLLVDCHIVSRQ